MNTFLGKPWNDAVFSKYVGTVPRVKVNAFLNSGVFRTRDDIKNLFPDQVGGHYALIPYVGRIGGNAQNYDGNTDVDTSETIAGLTQGAIITGRMKGWNELDFTYELTKKDFMQEIAKQVAGYWDDIDNATILNILTGIFAMTGADDFVDKHTFDISTADVPTVGATTLNSAIQQASGQSKDIYSMAIMHSAVATNLENMQVLDYLKYTDANGVQKKLTLATWNGRTVIVDDDVPVSGDVFDTYVLGAGAFDYFDAGAKKPVETVRDPKTKGGKDELIMRQRKMFAPCGISFKQTVAATTKSPTDAMLRAGTSWELMTTEKDKFSPKLIPIVRIKSKG